MGVTDGTDDVQGSIDGTFAAGSFGGSDGGSDGVDGGFDGFGGGSDGLDDGSDGSGGGFDGFVGLDCGDTGLVEADGWTHKICEGRVDWLTKRVVHERANGLTPKIREELTVG